MGIILCSNYKSKDKKITDFALEKQLVFLEGWCVLKESFELLHTLKLLRICDATELFEMHFYCFLKF